MANEANLIQKIREVLIADSALDAYIDKRVYASHISTISKPVYPAISLHLLNSLLRKSPPTMADVLLQIDIWMQSTKYNTSDLFTCAGRVRSLLHGETLSDTSIGVQVFNFSESGNANNMKVMFEEDTQLYHLPMIYEGVII